MRKLSAACLVTLENRDCRCPCRASSDLALGQPVVVRIVTATPSRPVPHVDVGVVVIEAGQLADRVPEPGTGRQPRPQTTVRVNTLPRRWRPPSAQPILPG